MARSYRFARSPGWVTGHVLVLAAAVAMGFLGHWQLDVSNAKHFSLQNFGYALQWWAFALFAIGMWLRIVRDQARRPSSAAPQTGPSSAAPPTGPPSAAPPTGPLPAAHPAEPLTQAPAPVAYRRYVMPQSTDVRWRAEDAEHAAYNAYLAGLNRAADEENS